MVLSAAVLVVEAAVLAVLVAVAAVLTAVLAAVRGPDLSPWRKEVQVRALVVLSEERCGLHRLLCL